ncbi:MAG: Cytochrome oxidase biogenesis protein Sco1/SenC/PrrC, putative copper metallochaperone [uncultured Thiotrichaceae bacterium]|uniref:Cytochrome oxidase biogenesis protein Sco1/SenC/PrrC, putative copper metallochaperone n=1 Tax=uncultured Thiotrichaceae bacterium TaxID=298394 RepID=A0A6S6SGZ8_9GAMM|nr:MAG: Cytochrome oxidase biogenesis protein Sco1/SenC/PrrC, putative copper metallochaperone [uncultured Thiotrichaceae bacterium]
MRRRTLFLITCLSIGIGLSAWYLFLSDTSNQSQPKLTPIAGQRFGGDFTLKAGDKPVSLSDYKGKVVLIYFGYASCPDVCPTSLALLGTALKRLEAEEVAQVQGIFISVDPERDQGEKLMAYAQYFHPNFIGVTGTLEELKQVAQQYGSFFGKSDDQSSALGYLVDHSSRTYVMGKDGELAHLLPHDKTVPEVLAAIRAALN